MNATAKITFVVGKRKTGKTDFSKNLIKMALASRPRDRALILDSFDNPPWRNQKTWNDPHNISEIPIIEIDQIPYWGSDPNLSQHRIMRTASKSVDKAFSYAMEYFYNGILLVEDATKVILGGRLSREQRDIVYDSKQKGVDLIFNFHFIRSIPRELANQGDALVIKKTNEPYNSDIVSRFPDPELRSLMKKVAENKAPFAHETLLLT